MNSIRLTDRVEPGMWKGHMDWELNDSGTFNHVSGELLLEQLVLKSIFVSRRFGRFGSRIRTVLGEKDLNIRNGMLNLFTNEAMAGLKTILDEYSQVYPLDSEETINQVLRVLVKADVTDPTAYQVYLDIIKGSIAVLSLSTKM